MGKRKRHDPETGNAINATFRVDHGLGIRPHTTVPHGWWRFLRVLLQKHRVAHRSRIVCLDLSSGPRKCSSAGWKNLSRLANSRTKYPPVVLMAHIVENNPWRLVRPRAAKGYRSPTLWQHRSNMHLKPVSLSLGGTVKFMAVGKNETEYHFRLRSPCERSRRLQVIRSAQTRCTWSAIAYQSSLVRGGQDDCAKRFSAGCCPLDLKMIRGFDRLRAIY